MKNKFNNKEFLVVVLFTVILIITSIYDCFMNSGEKIFRIALTFITVLLVYWLYIKSFLKGIKSIYYINIFFIFISMYLASVWNFYGIPNYDKFLHLLSGAVIAIIGYILFIYLTSQKSRSDMKPITSLIFVILFATAAAGVWEIWEFTTDSLFGLTAQNNSLRDTMLDIVCGTLVGIITAIPIYINSRFNKIKIINTIVKEIESNRK
ncbi:MAG: hypothetical protein IJO26_01180 [Clostridium sp.]|nr:hypothetical protein [Clostridium sp.]